MIWQVSQRAVKNSERNCFSIRTRKLAFRCSLWSLIRKGKAYFYATSYGIPESSWWSCLDKQSQWKSKSHAVVVISETSSPAQSQSFWTFRYNSMKERNIVQQPKPRHHQPNQSSFPLSPSNILSIPLYNFLHLLHPYTCQVLNSTKHISRPVTFFYKIIPSQAIRAHTQVSLSFAGALDVIVAIGWIRVEATLWTAGVGIDGVLSRALVV